MTKHIILIFCLLVLFWSCNKNEFLAKKPDESLLVPKTLEDLQAILDYSPVMNGGSNSFGGLDPVSGEVMSDNVFVQDNFLNIIPIELKNLYQWDDNLYRSGNGQQSIYDWDFGYRNILYSNTVLDGLDKISLSPDKKSKIDNLRGSALFYRAKMYFYLAQQYAQPYNPKTASSDKGVVIKTTSDINEKPVRVTNKETFEMIIGDLNEAYDLLPQIPTVKTRPSKAAVDALLSNIYLVMQDWEKSIEHASKCINSNYQLLNYNTLNKNLYNPFPTKFNDNPEVVFFSIMVFANTAYLLSRVDSTLLKQYSPKDIRRTFFFSAAEMFRAGYDPTNARFSGLAIDEIYLNRAEAYTRTGKVVDALSDVNKILENRIESNSFTPIAEQDQNELLKIVLRERRKELVWRGVRWRDLRRLNLLGENITVTRVINNQTKHLLPNDLRYTQLIPASVIGFNPNLEQSPR